MHDEDITTDELRQRVINHLESQGLKTGGVDLAKAYAFTECGGNITNRCNFSCIYCAHSGENGHVGFFRNEMEQERFLDFVDFLVCKGLKIFNFCGIGELTTYPKWQELLDLLSIRYPQLRIRVISNFGKELNDGELATLARLDLVHVSCDTLDANLYSRLRKGGRLPVLLENIRRLKEKFSGDPVRDPKLAFNVTATDAIIDKLENLFRFAAENDMFVHVSNLFVMEDSIASRTNCVKKISDMNNAQMPYIREVLYDLPRRMKAQNPLTNVWEYKFLYNAVMQKTDSITFNRFVPGSGEHVYDAFYQIHPRNPHAYLRKMWTSFDEAFRGIYIRAGKSIKIELPTAGKITYRAVWCRDRLDGNLDVIPGTISETVIAAGVEISARECNGKYSNMLFEVLSCDFSGAVETGAALISPTPPDNADAAILVRESFMMNEEETVVQSLVDSQEDVVIWCAGIRTLQMLSNTRLAEANIVMIIDGNPSRKGELFCGRAISSPEDLGDFTGKIIVIHATSPEQVELQIRKMRITNEILIL